MPPTFTYTFASNNGTTTTTTINNSPSPSITNPFSGATNPSSKWYYFLIKNDGNIDTISNINLDSNYIWYMFIVSNGGSAGLNSTTGYAAVGGGGGSGQLVNIEIEYNTISSIVLNPISDNTTILTTFTTTAGTLFTTTNTSPGVTLPPTTPPSIPPSTTYYLYSGLPGGDGSSSGQNGGGGSGGSANSFNSNGDPGSVGSAGGGGVKPGHNYTGYLQSSQINIPPTSTTLPPGTPTNLYGGYISIKFSDGTTGKIYAGNAGYSKNSYYYSAQSGNIGQVMFYCTPITN